MSDSKKRRKHRSSRSHSPRRSKSLKAKKKKHRHKKSKRRNHTRSRSRSRDRYDTTSPSDDSDSHSRSSKHKKSRKRKRSLSESSSFDYSSDSSTDSHKKRKKKRKERKRRKKEKKKKKKEKKKRKEQRKKEKALLNGNLSIYQPKDYKQGQHGFITPNDLIHKMPEFTSWLMDVHNVSIDSLIKREEKKWFNRFCDDWNTSTMPDDKYYDLEAWNKANGGGNVEMVHDDFMFGMSDEQQLNAQNRKLRQMEQDKRYNARVQEMKRHLIDLKSNNQKEFQNLENQHVQKQETFESLAAKRRRKKVEDQVKRFGKHPANFTMD